MTLNEIKLGTFARNTTRVVAALLAVVFIGGSLTRATPQRGEEIYCASDDERRHYCSADTRGGVRLARQRSGSPCILNRTWGFDRRGIWVDRGCRADFITGERYRDRDRDRDYDRDRGRVVQSFYCESGDGKRHYCNVGDRGTVRLVRQRSGSPCIEGRTWGRDQNGVWVDRGCRADFELRR